MRLEQLRQLRGQIQEIARRNGAREVRIFGSAARGTATETSDVDVLVDMEPGRSLLDLAGVKLDLEDLLGVRVDVTTERALRERLRDDVLRSAVRL